MKYLLDEKNNRETIYANDTYYDDCSKYTEVYSGEIGSSFLEFISLDFEEVKKNIIQIMEKQNDENDYTRFSEAFNEYFKSIHWLFLYFGIPKKLYEEYRVPPTNRAGKIPSVEDILNKIFSDIIDIQKIITVYSENKDFIDHEYLLRGIAFYEYMKCPNTIPFEQNTPFHIRFFPKDDDKNPIKKLKAFENYCKSIKQEAHEFSRLTDMFGAPFEWIAKNDYPISVCQNCGKFFVPYKRNDAKYCSHIFKDNKTCRELAFEIKVENDDVLRLYRKIYKTRNAWKNRNKNNKANAEKEFDEWHKSAKQKVDEFNMGKISKEECMIWLENSRRRE